MLSNGTTPMQIQSGQTVPLKFSFVLLCIVFVHCHCFQIRFSALKETDS
jgi:hypothetical protein